MIRFDPTNLKSNTEVAARELAVAVRRGVLQRLDELKRLHPGAGHEWREGGVRKSGTLEVSPTGEICRGEVRERPLRRGEHSWSLGCDHHGRKVYTCAEASLDGRGLAHLVQLTEAGPRQWWVSHQTFDGPHRRPRSSL